MTIKYEIQYLKKATEALIIIFIEKMAYSRCTVNLT